MIAAYYLIAVFIGGGPSPSSMTSTPMETLQLCESAAKKLESLEGIISKVRAVCVKAAE